MNDPYSCPSDSLFQAEFAVLDDEPFVNVLDWICFEAMAHEGKKYIGKHLTDLEAI